MNGHAASDGKILDMLKQDSQQGMVLLMEEYTGLIWHVISFHIKNPEDIRECVNETFTRFYFQRNKFNPEKASLAVYLTAIARKVAVSRYRRERIRQTEAFSEESPYDDRKLTAAELQMDIEHAMRVLKPNELQIIRMKYYDGMTVREIADSLELPYETVKKRHQRSIRKLRSSLLLMLLLLVLLSACVYGALRHFDLIPPLLPWLERNVPDEEPEPEPDNGRIPDNHTGIPVLDPSDKAPDDKEIPETEPAAESVMANDTENSEYESRILKMESYTFHPEYGVNTNPEVEIYTLSEKVQVESHDVIFTLEDATYINNRLTFVTTIYSPTDPIQTRMQNGEYFFSPGFHTLSCQDKTWGLQLCSVSTLDPYTNQEIYLFSEVVLPTEGQELKDLSLTSSLGIQFQFDLAPIEQETLNTYPYQLKEYGGVLAIPRLENGSLIMTFYPVNDGSEYQTLTTLLDLYPLQENEKITVTYEDGTIMEGECLSPYPLDIHICSEWDFGPAQPGSYTLNIPCLYQEVKPDQDFSIPINLLENSWEDREYEIPGGSIRIESCTPLDAAGLDMLYDEPISDCPAEHYWHLTLKYSSDNPDRTITDLDLNCTMDDAVQIDPTHNCSAPFMRTATISNNTETETMEFFLTADSARVDPASARFVFKNTGGISYRWNQSFEIPFTVQEQLQEQQN